MNVKMVIITQMKVKVLQDNVILHLFTMSFDLVTTPNAREYLQLCFLEKSAKFKWQLTLKLQAPIFVGGDVQDFIGGETFNTNETTTSLNPKPSPSPLCTYFEKWTIQLNVPTHLGFAHDHAWLRTPLHNHIYRPSLDFSFPSKTTKHLLWACFQKS